jgi:O-antigen ligase
METRSFGRKVILSALLGAMVVSACLTVSRGPLFAMVMEIALFVVVWCRAHWQRMVLAVLAAGVLLVSSFIIYATSDTVHRFIQSTANPSQISAGHVDEESSEYYRVALCKAVVERLDGPRWIYGLGPGTFFVDDVTSDYAGQQHVLSAADSLYLRSLLEVGVLGIAALLLLMWGTVRVCARGLSGTSSQAHLLALASLASVLGFIFANTTVSMLSLWPLTILFWMSPALVLAFPLQDQNRASLAFRP